MRHPPPRIATTAFCVAAGAWLSACSGLDQVSIHDPELATAALQAQSAWAGAGTADLWTTMLDNLERSASVERELLASTLDLRFEGQLQAVEYVTWAELDACARGQCGDNTTEAASELTGETILAVDFDLKSTSEKIAATAAELAAIGEEIATLSALLANDPSGANETGELSEAPTSELAAAIASGEAGIAALEEKLRAVKQERLGQLEEAIESLIPRLPPELGETRERIRTALTNRIAELQRALASVRFKALTATAVMEIEPLLANVGIPDDPEIERLVTRAIRNTFDEHFAPIEAHLDATNALLSEADALVAAALGEGTPPAERLALLADVLRKAEHLDFLKPDTLAEALEGAANRPLSGDVAEALGVDTVAELLELIRKPGAPLATLADKISIERLFEELRSEPLSSEFAAALETHTGRGIGSVGALLDYLKTDESRLQEVRVALLADWRRAVVEGRAQKLESLRYRLGLAQKLGRALEAQRLAEQGLAANLELARTCVPALFVEPEEPDPPLPIYDRLDSIARGTRFRAGSDGDCPDNFSTPRRQFESIVGIVGDYFARVGYLHDNERLAHYELVRYEHRRSIDASRLAAAAHEQLVAHGLQGLVSFTQGGITTEQVATVLRFVNAGLLNVIANQE